MSNLLSKILSKTTNNKGLLRKSGNMQFINSDEIMRVFLSLFYKNEVVVVLYNCNKMCEVIPKLQILKRDNWGAYYWASHTDTAILTFDSIAQAEDWVFSISRNALAEWDLFSNTILLRNEQGKVKPQTWDQGEENDQS